MSTQSVFLFPGQGSQSVGMGKDLYEQFQEFKDTFEEASDALNFSMEKLCFEDPNSQLNLTEFTQPAILAVSTGIFRILKARSQFNPTMVAGHSLGEYSALVALGTLKFSDALKAVHFRGQAMQRAVPVGVGAMAAYVGALGKEVAEMCKEISTSENKVEIANDNSPTQLVLSGHAEAVDTLCKIITEKKMGRAIKLPVSAPFHSSLMRPAAEEMLEFFEKIDLQDFKGQIVANVDAALHTRETYSKAMLIKQIASPVLWTQTMQFIHSQLPESEWIEVGPGKVLQGLVKKTLETQKCSITHNVTSITELLS